LEKIIKETKGYEQEIEISLTKDDLQPHYDKAYKKAQPLIKMQGFRPGKVPMNLVKKVYGREIEAEAEEEIINDIFTKIVEEDGLNPLSQPHLHDLKKENGELKFTVHFEVVPNFQIVEYKGIVVDEPVHRVTDKEIEKHIEKLCKDHATFDTATSIDDYDHVVGLKLRLLDLETGLPLIDEAPAEEHLYLGDEKIVKELKESLLNLKGGDVFDLVLFNPKTNEPAKFQIEVNEIQKVIPAEFSNELVEKITDGKFLTTEDFREDLGFKLQEKWDEISHNQLEENLIVKIMEAQPDFDLPPSFVDRLIKSIYEDIKKRYKLKTDKEIEKYISFEEAEMMAHRFGKWEIVRNKIIEIEDIKIEDHDIDEEISRFAEQYKLEHDYIKEFLLKDNNFINSKLVKKVMDFLLDFAITNEVAFEGDELNLSLLQDEFEEDFEEEEDDDEFDDDIDEEEFDEDEFIDEDFDEDEFEEEFDENDIVEEDIEDFDDDDEEDELDEDAKKI
jgi:trigger factor